MGKGNHMTRLCLETCLSIRPGRSLSICILQAKEAVVLVASIRAYIYIHTYY